MAQAERECPSCGKTKPASEFYANCSECKSCKRGRSKADRQLQARKIALAERLIDVLAALAASADGQPGRQPGEPRSRAAEAA